MNLTKSNIYDKLLYYISHEGVLPWEKFKNAITRLTQNRKPHEPSTYLKSLARMGHIDYDPMNLSKVAILIAPAVLIDTAVENQFVLVGSRTPKFIEEVKKCVADTGGKLNIKSDRYAPKTIVLSELTDNAFSDIESIGIHISLSFPAKLSELLPIPKPTDFPRNNTNIPDRVNKFNLNNLEFEPYNQRQRNNGLYEIPQYGPSVYILKFGVDQYIVPRDWGIWFTLSNPGKTTKYVTYNKGTETLRVRVPLNLPLILDRCATLCSGFPPQLKGDFFHYSDVPVGIACQLTKSLHQKWENV